MENFDTIITVVSLMALSVITALFSASETVINHLRKGDILRIAEAGGKEFDLLESLLRHPRQYATTITVLKGALMVGIVALFTVKISAVLGAVIAAVVLILFTELIPKSYIHGTSKQSIVRTLRFLRFIHWIFLPIIKPLELLSNLGVRAIGGTIEERHNSIVSEELLDTIANIGDSNELLDDDEREMISRIVNLSDKVAREVMIPRIDVIAIEASTSMEEVLRISINSRHSRIPVYEKSIDRIIGILRVKELLDCWAEGKALELKSLVTGRPPFFAPESKKIWNLFQNLQENKQHLAIIVDEYGGVAGLVTLEDIIEEIVGEIQDEYDTDEQLECIRLDENIYSIDARMSIDTFNELLGTGLEVGHVDTVGGFVVDQLGKVPSEAEDFSLENLKFTVLEATNRRIRRLKVQPDKSGL